MKNLICLAILFLLSTKSFCQGRDINKLTLETTYSHAQIHKTLRDLVDGTEKSSYFDDDFFNSLLRKIILDKQFTDLEKVKLFYLMQEKIGYAFVGVSYLPPKQNYFNLYSGVAITWQKTKQSLKDLNPDVTGLLALADSNLTRDAIVSSNALLLASMINTDSVLKKLHSYSKADVIWKSKNPDIFNHYVCLSSSLVQDTMVVSNLSANIMSFKQESFIEDAFCAIYTRNNPVKLIHDYILYEKNPKNDLAIQTALCALAARVPLATFQKSVKSLLVESKDKWKTDLCRNILNNKIPFNYSLTNKEQLVTKISDGVQLSVYNDGLLISNGSIMEFDPN
jgi:hypothetical protein